MTSSLAISPSRNQHLPSPPHDHPNHLCNSMNTSCSRFCSVLSPKDGVLEDVLGLEDTVECL